MKKIIKEGKEKKSIIFTCPSCETVYESDEYLRERVFTKGVFMVKASRLINHYGSTCPKCSNSFVINDYFEGPKFSI